MVFGPQHELRTFALGDSRAELSRGCTRGRQPSCGGSRSIDACQRFLLARGVPGVGGTRPPRLAPEGKREKGVKFVAPQAFIAGSHYTPFWLSCCVRVFGLRRLKLWPGKLPHPHHIAPHSTP